MLDVPNDLDSQKVANNNNLINKYLSGPRETSAESEKSFSYEAKKLYQNDVSGYVALLKQVIDEGRIDSKNTFLCRDIKSIKDYDAFLDLAKHAINAKVLSEADKLDLNKEFLDRLLLLNQDDPTITTNELAPKILASKIVDGFKKLYPNNNECRLSLLAAVRVMGSPFMNYFMNSFRDAVNQLLPPNTAMAPTTSATSATGSPNRYS